MSVSIPPSPLKWRTFDQVHSTRHEFLLVEKTSSLIQKWLVTPITVMLTGTRLPWYVSIIAYRWAIPLKAFLLYWPTGYLLALWKLANRVKIFRTIPGWFSQIKFLFYFFLFWGGQREGWYFGLQYFGITLSQAESIMVGTAWQLRQEAKYSYPLLQAGRRRKQGMVHIINLSNLSPMTYFIEQAGTS